MRKEFVPFPICVECNGRRLEGFITPFSFTTAFGLPYLFRIVLDQQYCGDLKFEDGAWFSPDKSPEMTQAIAEYIMLWYE